jgi:hypothetical protein
MECGDCVCKHWGVQGSGVVEEVHLVQQGAMSHMAACAQQGGTEQVYVG